MHAELGLVLGDGLLQVREVSCLFPVAQPLHPDLGDLALTNAGSAGIITVVGQRLSMPDQQLPQPFGQAGAFQGRLDVLVIGLDAIGKFSYNFV